MDHQIGSLEINKIGNIAIFDEEFKCLATFVKGEKVALNE